MKPLSKIVPTQLSRLAKLADMLMAPIMYLISGTFKEAPQQTHLWNNVILSSSQVDNLDRTKMVISKPVVTERDSPRRILGIPIFHIPILGGWKNYLVLEPVDHTGNWCVGWISDDTTGVSKLRNTGPIRVLITNKECLFFGIDPETSEQVSITDVARGKIGAGGDFKDTPLL